jgi:hypothetical protein
MNRYGLMAQRHWAQWLPQRYATISEPDSYFSTLGQEVARQIEELTLDLAGDDQPGEEYLAKAGRLTAARSQAEEIVLPERVLPTPEPETSKDPEDSSQPPPPSPALPQVVDRSHPAWAEVNAEQTEREQGS